MPDADKLGQLKSMLEQVAPDGGLEGVAKTMPPPATLGPEADAAVATAQSGLKKIAKGKDISPEEQFGLEAIILPRLRPVVFVLDGRYDKLTHNLWTHLNGDDFHGRLDPLLASIGRIELPNSSVPYGGTGFVVGPDLVMTNRHVARLFAEGVGTRRLVYHGGDAAIDFKRERDSREDDRSATLEVREVAMVHPYWDMALLRVAGLPAGRRPLKLSTRPPEELAEQEVAAVGYPAPDPRNNQRVQKQVFGEKYEVKRFQPGKMKARRPVTSFDHQVNALTHDSSTLGGNSGSAVIDLTTGEVVGLHFGGRYLDANYAVPTYELARDSRVVACGLEFAGRLPPTDSWAGAWKRADGNGGDGDTDRPERDAPNGGRTDRPTATLTAGAGATWSIPIQVTITVGEPTRGGPAARPAEGDEPPAGAGLEAWPMQPPKIYPNLKARAGYDPAFLDLPNGEEVPLPKLTADGKKVAAPLDDDEYELKYHHFSVVMHKKRRLALFTAANVDWRRDSREVNGRVPSRKQLTEIPDKVVEEWVTDRRISLEHQLPDVFFTKDRAAWDKGHLVRRDDVCWAAEDLTGQRKFKDIQKANGDTYHTTNCSPQVAGFNRPGGTDNWGDLEKMVQEETNAEKVILFSGPVLAEDDREFQGRDLNGEVWVPIPSRFWKIIVAAGDDGPRAYGFVLKQNFKGVRWTEEELIVPEEWETYMKPIAEIEELLFGLAKLDWLKAHDGANSTEGVRIAGRVQPKR